MKRARILRIACLWGSVVFALTAGASLQFAHLAKPSRRPDLNSLSSGERQALAELMLAYLSDEVVAHHAHINHSGATLLTGHREYIEGLERYLQDVGAERFVPLPAWNPANAIPAEFMVVRAADDGKERPPLQNATPNLPVPAEFQVPQLCSFATTQDLGSAINGWHGRVHGTIDGTMSDLLIASAAPIFWCWHAFLDDIYAEWERCDHAGAAPPGGHDHGGHDHGRSPSPGPSPALPPPPAPPGAP